MSSLPAISTTGSLEQIEAVLKAASPAVRNPAGEWVAVTEAWREEVAADPQRLALLPAALTALRNAHEVWRFYDETDSIEHQPHLLWCRLDAAPDRELIVAGTRRVDGELRLHTWFRIEEPQEALGRYLRQGTRLFPVLAARVVYQPRIDVLYLEPEPAVSYRVLRLSPDVPAYAYLSHAAGFPSLTGLEFQDVRRRGRALVDHPALSSLMKTRCRDEGREATLGEHLAELLDSKAPAGDAA